MKKRPAAKEGMPRGKMFVVEAMRKKIESFQLNQQFLFCQER
jgi:hypothetical protein